jgi:hypothetical protein
VSLVRTVDAWTPLVAGVTAYLTDPDRLGTAAPPVEAGEWMTTWNDGPARVVIGLGKRLIYAGAAAESPGYRSSPNDVWDNGDGTASPVVGVRKQSFTAWVWSPAPGDFASQDPTAYALAGRLSVLALADTVHAALRYIASHDLLGEDGQPYGEQRGEFVYGGALSFGFMVPVPVLGDAYPYVTPAGMTASALFAGTMPGDAVST